VTDIRINAPGAGDWIMSRVGGVFTPRYDHSFARFLGSNVRGGFVLTQYLGNSMTVHMAGDDKRWCNRELLWLVFHYAFIQLGCSKLLSPMAADDEVSMPMQIRAGWQIEAVVKDVYAPGRHMLVLTMSREACPWLNYRPKDWQDGKAVATACA
jgi:hypothetical protein